MSKRLSRLALPFLLFATVIHGHAKESAAQSIEGAWKLVEIISPDGVKNSAPQPGMWMFTEKHYGLGMVLGTKVRVQPDAVAQALGVKKVSLWDAFVANTGTYSVSGNMLTTVPIVAEAEEAMTNGFLLKYEMNFEGNDTVSLTTKAGGGVNSVWKLQRLE